MSSSFFWVYISVEEILFSWFFSDELLETQTFKDMYKKLAFLYITYTLLCTYEDDPDYKNSSH